MATEGAVRQAFALSDSGFVDAIAYPVSWRRTLYS